MSGILCFMLRIIFWAVIAILFLSFFGISLQALIENPTTQSNLSFAWELVREGWRIILAWIESIRTTII